MGVRGDCSWTCGDCSWTCGDSSWKDMERKTWKGPDNRSGTTCKVLSILKINSCSCYVRNSVLKE